MPFIICAFDSTNRDSHLRPTISAMAGKLSTVTHPTGDHRHHCTCSSPGTQRSASILSTEVQSIRTFGTARPKLREGDLLPDLGVATLDSLQVSLLPTRHTAPTPVKRLELHFPVDSPLQGTDFTILRRRPSAGTRKDSLRRDRPPFL